MEREQRRLFVRNQLWDLRRSRLSRTPRLCRVVAPARWAQWRHQDRRLAFQDVRWRRGSLHTAGVPHDQADGDARDHARRSVWIFCGD